MPISREQFDSVPDGVVAYLQDHQDEAFTAEELVAAVAKVWRPTDMVGHLFGRDDVDHRLMGAHFYFAYTKPDPLIDPRGG
ncbi:MAG: hypothetical protein Q8N61_01405 [bacterium]|nr:hypothetical protein [bacterium]